MGDGARLLAGDLTRRHAEVAAFGYAINACIVLAIGTMGLGVMALVAAMCCARLLAGLIIPSRDMRWLAVQSLRHSLCEECARMNGSESRPIFPQVCMARSERMRPVVVTLHRRAGFGFYLTRLVAAAARPALRSGSESSRPAATTGRGYSATSERAHERQQNTIPCAVPQHCADVSVVGGYLLAQIGCLTLAAAVRDPVTTIEGLTEPGGALHPMQQAFIDRDPKPKVAATPADTLEATSTFASPAPPNRPTVPAFSAAEIAGLLARGDWLAA